MNVSIVGTGTMAAGIIELLIFQDSIEGILLLGIDQKKAEGIKNRTDRKIKKWIRKNVVSEELQNRIINKLSIVDSYRDLENSDWVIEAVTEDIEIKKKVFSELDKVVGRETYLTSNTSSLSIEELASETSSPDRVIGLHFFNPAPIMKLVEIITGPLTSEKTKKWAVETVERIGKKPVLVKDSPGFIVNRMLMPMINEAVSIYSEGIASARDIDNAMKLGANHPIGPLALADLIGIDIVLSILDTLFQKTKDVKYKAHPLLGEMIQNNRLGKKTGNGFFQY